MGGSLKTTMRSADSAAVPVGAETPSRMVLFDTNVWLDYFLGREPVSSDVARLIEALHVNDYGIAVTVAIKKDVFYILPRELRRRGSISSAGEEVRCSEESYAQVAWAVLDRIDELATVVPLGMREDFFARHMRQDHTDYEDDALVATARSIGARCTVTSDSRLIGRFPQLCLTPAQACRLFGEP